MSQTHAWEIEKPGHKTQVNVSGRDEPRTFRPRCSCGWVGVVVSEKWFSDEEKDFSYFAEPWRTVARTYGPDQTLKPGSVFGSEDTALKLVLAHMDYNPDADVSLTEGTYRATAVKAAQALANDTVAVADELYLAAEELQRALHRNTVWATIEIPSLPVLIPEARAIIEEHLEAQRRERDAAAKRPFTPDEIEVLTRSGIEL